MSVRDMRSIVVDGDGVRRFRKNKICRFLLDDGPFDLNQLAMMGFDAETHSEFAELIGYSVSGYSELDYVSDERYAHAEMRAKDAARPEASDG